jgi:hypothetical protein
MDVKSSDFQVLQDAKLEQWEVNAWLDRLAQEIKNGKTVTIDGQKYTKSDADHKKKWQELKAKLLNKAVAKEAEPKSQVIKTNKKFKETRLKISTYLDKLDSLKEEIQKIEKKGKQQSKADKFRLKELKAERKRVEKRIKTMNNNINSSDNTGKWKVKDSRLNDLYSESKTKQKTGGSGESSTSGTTKSGKAQTLGNSKAGTSTPTTKSGKAQTLSNTSAKADSLAYQQALGMESSMMSSWDDIYSNQSRGKKLMMIMLYVMRMALSGDMFAQVMLLRVITQIIGMDKAQQNVLMSKKLIQLQKASREVTEKLMNTETTDTTESQNNFTKVLQWAKSESDSIATSQKLIAQMMEEFTQVKSSLESLTKSATTKWGQTMNYLSRF